LKLVGGAGMLGRMKKYQLREVPTRRSVHVILLAVAAFTLGEYSEKASFAAWGWAAVIASIIVFAMVLLLLMRDFWGADA
jgi:hypothetical protein